MALALVGCDDATIAPERDGALARPDAQLAPSDAGVDARLDASAGADRDAALPLDGGAYFELDGGEYVEPDAGPIPPEPPEPPEPEPPPEPDEEEPTEVRTSYRVLHWNIAGGKEHDCRTAAITDAVVRLVRERDADLVGLNEVCRSQYDAIREALRRHWGKGDAATFSAYGSTGRVGNAIFSRQNLTGVTRHKIGEDRYGERNLTCGRIGVRPHLRFCSTHLSPGTTLARAQLERVHTRIEAWWANRRDTVILTGDFNLEPNDRAFDAIYAEGANHPTNNPNNRGVYRELDDADAAHCRGYGERSVPRTGGGPCREGRKIDLMFVRRNRIVDGRYGSDALNIPTSCGGLCSDHRPVIGHARVRVQLD